MRRLGVVLALLVVAAPSPAEAVPAAVIPAGSELASLSDYRFTLLGLEAYPAAERAVAARGGTIVATDLHIWRLPSEEAKRLIPRLSRSGALRFAEADRPVFRQGHLNGGDPLAAPTVGWHHYHVGSDRAEPPGPGVPITIVDAGLDTAHMEFAARPNTFLLNRQEVSFDSDGYHGTIVSSTAAAPTDGKGAVGIYPQAILREYDLDFLSESAIVAGITRAVAAGRSVINLSLGGDEPSRSIYEATINAFGRGSLVVAAAGNDRQFDDPAIYPAGFPHVLTVGSTNQADLPSDFSSTSAAVDLAAPGESIPWQYPSDPTFFGAASGTSFAAPMVTAAAAWVWTVRGMLEKTQIFELMRASARDIAPVGPDNRTGPTTTSTTSRRRGSSASRRGRSRLRADGEPRIARASMRRRIRTTSTASGSLPGAPSVRPSAPTRTSTRGCGGHGRETSPRTGRRGDATCLRPARSREAGRRPSAWRTGRRAATTPTSTSSSPGASAPRATASASVLALCSRGRVRDAEAGRADARLAHANPHPPRWKPCRQLVGDSRRQHLDQPELRAIGDLLHARRHRAVVDRLLDPVGAGLFDVELDVVEERPALLSLVLVDPMSPENLEPDELDRHVSTGHFRRPHGQSPHGLKETSQAMSRARRARSSRVDRPFQAAARATPARPEGDIASDVSGPTSSIARSTHDRPSRRQRLDVLPHVVNAKDRRTALVGGDRRGDARRERARLGVGIAEDLPQRALAGESHHEWPPERRQLIQPPDQLEVVLDRLAEADAGVEADAVFGDPRLDCKAQSLLEERLHVVDDVVVARVQLHGPRLAEHVHQADVESGSGDDVGHARVAAQRGDVVDELRTERDRPPRDLGLRGVDRHRQLLADLLQNRQHPRQLFLDGDGTRAGTRGFPADVDDRRPFIEHSTSVRDGVLRSQVDAAVRERVRRHVHDAHHRGARQSRVDRRKTANRHREKVSHSAAAPSA